MKKKRRSNKETLREKTEKAKAEREKMPACERTDCHAWQDGKCVALWDNHFGSRSCPFYKLRSVCQKEQQECLAKLIREGRMDLVEKYKTVLVELGISAPVDAYAERAAAELEKYKEECLNELLAGEGAVHGDQDGAEKSGGPGEQDGPEGQPGQDIRFGTDGEDDWAD